MLRSVESYGWTKAGEEVLRRGERD